MPNQIDSVEMYYWRKMIDQERADTINERKARKIAWHGPPHLTYDGEQSFIVTAACYEHRPVIGTSSARMAECEAELVELCDREKVLLHAWCILPNHYHLLVRTDRIREFQINGLGKFHGASSFRWNTEDASRGRKVWYKSFERPMKSYRTSMNYVHHNAVKHGYVSRWQDWPYGSAPRFLELFGPDKASHIWRGYPVLDYGKDWDID